jgi:hypothetical protein
MKYSLEPSPIYRAQTHTNETHVCKSLLKYRSAFNVNYIQTEPNAEGNTKMCLAFKQYLLYSLIINNFI